MPKPFKTIMVGPARATIFMNTVTKAGKPFQMPKVAFEIRYKTPSGHWQGTTSMTLAELPKAILALQQAYQYLMTASRGRKSPHQQTSPFSLAPHNR